MDALLDLVPWVIRAVTRIFWAVGFIACAVQASRYDGVAFWALVLVSAVNLALFVDKEPRQ